MIVILLGAGASIDGAVYRHGDDVAPLAADLFDGRYKAVLDHYRLASHAAEDIRDGLASGRGIEAILSEDFARAAAGSQRPRRYREVPLYLQHLLANVSTAGSREPTRYRRLVNKTLDLESAIFVTLNYDTVLDRLLFEHTTLPRGLPRDVDDYISQEQWSLIKLHGSVDWGRKVGVEDSLWEGDAGAYCTRYYHLVGDRLESSLESITVRATQLADRLTSFRFDGKLWYPALTVPLGADDELNCPPEHLGFLRSRLGEVDDADLLVIGYSACDARALELLAAAANPFRSLHVVDLHHDKAMGIARTILKHVNVRGGDIASAAPGGFRHWAESGDEDGMNQYFARLRS